MSKLLVISLLSDLTIKFLINLQAVMTEEEFGIYNLNSCILLTQSFNNPFAERQIGSMLNQIIDKGVKVNL